MATVTLRGVPISFPFEPYDLQKDYMEKVLECLQNETNGVLESPTGTGKTLSLLCSTLAWLELKKAQLQAHRAIAGVEESGDFWNQLNRNLKNAAGKETSPMPMTNSPVIIYASRTHSQLSQAIKELKHTSYKHMKACVIGSRDQLCIHPEIMREKNTSLKNTMCQMKVKTRSCQYYNRVDTMKEDPNIKDKPILDIEDLCKLGQTHKFCPYYMSSDLKGQADIIFMPYNYILDPRSRRVLGLEMRNHIIILDEAHNVEKMCEESASVQLKSSDIALAIEEITAVMKMVSEEVVSFDDTPKDFSADDLCVMKQMLLDMEKEIDNTVLKAGSEGMTFQSSFLFELLAKAGITSGNFNNVVTLIANITQFLATMNEGPFSRRGVGLQSLDDTLRVVFSGDGSDFIEKVNRCYKVHISEEEVKKKKGGDWLSKATAKAGGKIINYWCFSPGFGMNQLLKHTGLRCVILTSGTLAPLRPLISELEMNVQVRLENPHIVTGDQVCVKIISKGPDSEELNCSYRNRDNPKYVNSLGRAILNLVRVIPNGLLIFFPSYPIMLKCSQIWQENGIWSQLYAQKAIYVEPRDKESFESAMRDFYAKVQDPTLKGAIFMGVCRGKVSEGLDFVDANGRAVIVTGLPYPPMMDPRVILKKKYLDICNSKDKEFLRGDEWYSLEATRAVNQAIGRVIRHRNDYGAILLMDSRFNNPRIKDQMSVWLRDHIKIVSNFGEVMKSMRQFFTIAEERFPSKLKPLENKVKQVPAEFSSSTKSYKASSNFNFSSSSLPSCSAQNALGEAQDKIKENPSKRRKIMLLPNASNKEAPVETSVKEYVLMLQKSLDAQSFKVYIDAMKAYKEKSDLNELCLALDVIFRGKAHLRYIIRGMESFIKSEHKSAFVDYCDKST